MTMEGMYHYCDPKDEGERERMLTVPAPSQFDHNSPPERILPRPIYHLN